MFFTYQPDIFAIPQMLQHHEAKMQCREEEIFQRLSARAQDIVKDGGFPRCSWGEIKGRTYRVRVYENIVGVNMYLLRKTMYTYTYIASISVYESILC